MTQYEAAQYLQANRRYLPAEKLADLRQRLLRTDRTRGFLEDAAAFQDPTKVLLTSIFLGGLGVDRFMLGSRGVGALKLFTYGGFGVMAAADWFTARRRTRAWNYESLLHIL